MHHSRCSGAVASDVGTLDDADSGSQVYAVADVATADTMPTITGSITEAAPTPTVSETFVGPVTTCPSPDATTDTKTSGASMAAVGLATFAAVVAAVIV